MKLYLCRKHSGCLPPHFKPSSGILLMSELLFPGFFIILCVCVSCSVVSNSLRPYGLQHAKPLITNSRGLLKLTSIESVMPSNHLILCCPLLLLPSISPSIRVFSNESALHVRWPKYWVGKGTNKNVEMKK